MSTTFSAPELAPETSRVDATKLPSQGRVYFLALSLLALFLRVGAVVSMARGEPRTWFFGQASELGCLAQSVLDGHGLASPFGGSTGPSAFLAPGYPLLVALAFRIGGSYSAAAAALLMALQVLFGVLTVALLMFIAHRLFGRPAANIAGILCAIHPLLICLPGMFWETSFSMLSVVTVIALAVSCVDGRPRIHWVSLGAMIALASLVNPALTLTFAAVLAWAAWSTKHRSRTQPLLAAAVWFLIFAVWPVRNEITMHRFIPLRSNLGYELWQGNRLGSDGSFDSRLHPNTNRSEFAKYAKEGETTYMHKKYVLALSIIKADPMRFFRLSLTRTGQFWLGLRGRDTSKLVAASVSTSSLLAFAGLGFLLRSRRHIRLLFLAPLLLYPIPYYLTHADFRFRLVLEPIALLLSTYSLQLIFDFVKFRIVRPGRRLPTQRGIYSGI